jgi:GNAT superfamily N-acetyltransferase
MDDLEPLVRLFVALDDLLERRDPAWWGAVVTDSRIPLIYDANYARVEADGEVTLAEIESALLPSLERIGCKHVHVVVFRPERSERLLTDLKASGGRLTHDTAMRFDGSASGPETYDVQERAPSDSTFWVEQRRTLPEFDVTDPSTIEQFLGWEREVLAPAGKRWFGVHIDGEAAGFGALFVHDGTAYVDNVVTFAPFRRRGVASAIVGRIVHEALRGGAGDVFLLADEPGPVRLYERLGFRAVGEVVGSLRMLR